jgi:hypothetical protein
MKHTPLAERPTAAQELEPAVRPKPPEEAKLAEELQNMQYEPLLPIEKKLVLWSVLLGLFLLGVLIWVTNTFFHG